MRSIPWLVLPVPFLLQGCVHFHKNSGTADTNEIRQHLVSQLHCQVLELREVNENHFSGTGKNETGEFTVEVTREGEQIRFRGVFTEPAKGTFSGSASWSKEMSGFLGSHKSKVAEENSLGTP
jgi:hypothetical protein